MSYGRDEGGPGGRREYERGAVGVLGVADGDEGGGGREVVGYFEAGAAVRVAVAALAPRHGRQVDGSHGASSSICPMNFRDSAGDSARSRIESYASCSRSTGLDSSMSSPR